MKKGTLATRCLGALNGVIGNRLDAKRGGLAVKMTLYFKNRPLTLTKKSLSTAGLPNSGRICILAHGSCASEEDWRFPNHPTTNYGSLLQSELGLSPFFLRYNSGLHISANGKHLSRLLERFILNYPVPVTEIVLIGHSMGGLVYRSACHYGKKSGKNWTRRVKKIFYLGTPHLGSYLEKLGKLVTSVLDIIPNPVTKAIVLLGDLRSDGIKDLRHGYLTEQDWKHQRADHLFYYPINKTPLLEGADHYLICGSLLKNPDSKLARFFGDGVVPTASGTGQGLLRSSAIPFLAGHCRVFPNTSHYQLVHSRPVYQQIKNWLSP